MNKTYLKVAFVVALAVFLIAASIDIKNSGVLVTNGYVVAPVSIPDGTAAAPSVKFTSDPNSGLYSAGADQPAISAGGVISGKFTTGGLDLGGLDLTCNQATATVDAITGLTAPSTTSVVASDGILLRNTTAAATAQEFSPSLRLDGVGYTAGPTNTRQSWAITNKPTSATGAKLAFDLASGGGVYAEKVYIDNYGAIYSPSTVSARAGLTTLSSISANVYGAYNPANTVGVQTGVADSSSSLLFEISRTSAMSSEGSRILSATSGASGTTKSSIDKDGVYQQAYASGQVTDAVPSLDLTLVTAMDDDSIYNVVVGCEYIGYAAGAVGTPNHYFSSRIDATFARVDTVAAEVGANTVVSHKESTAGCVPCVVSITDAAGAGADIIKVTFAQCDLAADVANVKAWIERMEKTNITTFTGVNQPAAN